MVIRAKHSACGEDGVPYTAYKDNSLLSVRVSIVVFVTWPHVPP